MVAVLLPNGQTPDELPDSLFPDIESFSTYEEVINSDGESVLGYIAGEFAASLFPDDSLYTIGDHSELDDGGYENGPLRYGSSFTFFLRSYPLLDDTVSTMELYHCANHIFGTL